MNRSLTDRERCMALEARVAELEEELAAWRGDSAQDLRSHHALQRAIRIRDRLQLLDHRCALVATGVLIRMLDDPDVTVTKLQLLEASRHPGVRLDYEPTLKVADVQVSFLRSGLRRLGHGDAIQTVRGVGYRIPAFRAEQLRAVLDPAA